MYCNTSGRISSILNEPTIANVKLPASANRSRQTAAAVSRSISESISGETGRRRKCPPDIVICILSPNTVSGRAIRFSIDAFVRDFHDSNAFGSTRGAVTLR
jgi:hypothetical protein